jgi:hypothetical protein
MKIGIALALLIIGWYGILAMSWMAICWQAAAMAFFASVVTALVVTLVGND